VSRFQLILDQKGAALGEIARVVIVKKDDCFLVREFQGMLEV
jgi:RecB family endonuclease NucS